MIFGIKIIFLLVIISGIIAYIGDLLGRFIGRYKLSLFSLRPKHTAILISILSGILITVFTLATLIVISQDAKTALFGIEKLKKDISFFQERLGIAKEELESTNKKLESTSEKLANTENELSEKIKELEESKVELNEAQTEIARLDKVKKSLEKEINVTRKGKFIYSVNESILVTLIDGNPDPKKVEKELKKIESIMNTYLKRYTDKKENVKVKNFKEAVSELTGNLKEYILRIVVDKNVLFGEEVPVHYEVIQNDVIYTKDQVIARVEIDSDLSIQKIEQKLKNVLSGVHKLARNKGIVPDVSGSIGSVSYSEIYDTAKKIKEKGGDVAVEIIASKDIMTIGPLEVVFDL